MNQEAQRQQQHVATNEPGLDSTVPSLNEIAEATAQRLTNAVTPRNIAEVELLARYAAKAGLFGCKSEADAFVRIVTGAELGIAPYTALRGIFVIEGKPGLDATLIRGLIRRAVDCEYVRVVESTDVRATIESKRRGEPPCRTTYTIEEAKRAGLVGKATWQKFPRGLCLARCSSMHGREAWPDILSGVYTADELEPTPMDGVPSSPLDSSTADQATAFIDAISMAEDERALNEIGLAISKATLTGEQSKAVRDAYKRRGSELRGAKRQRGKDAPQAAPSAPDQGETPVDPDGPDGVDAEPTTREPGQEV